MMIRQILSNYFKSILKRLVIDEIQLTRHISQAKVLAITYHLMVIQWSTQM